MHRTIHDSPARVKRMRLRSGDRMTRWEFHALYEQTPEDFKAELIGGTVYVASPMTADHGEGQGALGTLFGVYSSRTFGTRGGENSTLLLADDSEPQLDVYLRILSECGGQGRKNADGYLEGAPELIAEIAYSSHAIDLHLKRPAFEAPRLFTSTLCWTWLIPARDGLICGPIASWRLTPTASCDRVCFRDCGSTPRPCWRTTSHARSPRWSRV